jgi:hypothetical protein
MTASALQKHGARRADKLVLPRGFDAALEVAATAPSRTCRDILDRDDDRRSLELPHS